MGRLIKHIPNLMTMTNLALGMWSISLLIHQNNPIRAAMLILLGAVIDFFDGNLARKLNVVSDMGKQLDSFADIITFGVAPVVLINHIYAEHSFSTLVWLASMVFIVAGAYRLARFNTMDFSKHFLGLPIPVAGGALTVYTLLQPIWIKHFQIPVYPKITALFLILLSIMMASKKKINRNWRPRNTLSAKNQNGYHK